MTVSRANNSEKREKKKNKKKKAKRNENFEGMINVYRQNKQDENS